jgi:hypothetical protein
MREAQRARVQLPVPVAIAVVGSGGAAGLHLANLTPVGVIVALVAAVGAVVVGRQQTSEFICGSCGGKDGLDAEAEAELTRRERDNERQQLRGELEPEILAEQRPELERHLRAELAKELRPLIEVEVERELRPRLLAELEPRIRASVEGETQARMQAEMQTRLRSELERVMAQMFASAAGAAVAIGDVPPPPPRRPKPPTPPPRRAPPPTPPPSPSSPEFDPPTNVVFDPTIRARRLARVIVSDIMLYYQDKMVEAARADDPKQSLDAVWAEAERFYRDTIAPEVLECTNYLDEELYTAIEQLRTEH